MEKRKINVALVGNPNAGKTTIFNALTGAKQHIGNWPGVTVDLKEGAFRLSNGNDVEIVDLPGIYSLVATSEDERVAVEYALSGKADLFINILDGTNLERNLYLTALLAELKVPMVHVVTMMDIVESRGISLNLDTLSEQLKAPVIGVNSTKSSKKAIVKLVEDYVEKHLQSSLEIAFPREIESAIEALSPCCQKVAEENKAPARWVALRILEADPLFTQKVIASGTISQEKIDELFGNVEKELKVFPDEAVAAARYRVIGEIFKAVSEKKSEGENLSQKADKIILNRFLGIPIFLVVMYVMFWLVAVVGGAFIDFFDVLGDTIFVGGTRYLLELAEAPDFLIALLSSGLGASLQTMATFIPPISAMFICLAILEDSGYMARAAFVMDRFMRFLGLPGKSFVPLLVGFGCSVPAIMATRTLENKRDRFLTIFMTPFMSCGAKLPVYIVFACAFFAENAGQMVFLLYVIGMFLAVVMGLILKKTLFQGEPSPFIMELPPYHVPGIRQVFQSAWDRLKLFIIRGGKILVPMILILGVLNTVGYVPEVEVDEEGNPVLDENGEEKIVTDEAGNPVMIWTIDNDDTEDSLLATIGTKITPIFKPMGIEEENWPATVAIFTGLFAKEAVAATLNGLYGQNEFFSKDEEKDEEGAEEAASEAEENEKVAAVPAEEADSDKDAVPAEEAEGEVVAAAEEAEEEEEDEDDEEYDFWGGIKEAFETIPENLSEVFAAFLDPLGTGDISDDEEEVAEANELDTSVFANMRAAFTGGKCQAFAYLLFVLLYVPCLAAMTAAFRELGAFFGIVFAAYLTLLGWTLATLFYQITLGHDPVYIALAAAIFVAMVISFYLMGKRQKVNFV